MLMNFFAEPYRSSKIWLSRLTLALILYSLLGFFLIPWLIKTQTPGLIKESLKREARLEHVAFNPFTLELKLDGFKLLESDKKSPFISFEHLYLNYGLWQTLKHWGIGIQAIHLDGLYGHLNIKGPQQFNFSDLLSEQKPEPEETESTAPTLWIGDLNITDGRFLFEDQTRNKPYQKTFEHLNLSLQNFITIPDGITPYDLTLHLTGGGNLHLQGELTLTPLSANGQINLNALNLRPLWEYAQQDLDFTLSKGLLSFQTQFHFEQQKENQSVKLENTQLSLANLQLQTHDPARLNIALPNLVLKDLSLDYHAGSQQSLKLLNPDLTLNKLSVTATGNVHYQIAIEQLALAQTRFLMENAQQNPRQQLSLQSFTISQLQIGDTRSPGQLIQLPSTRINDAQLDLSHQKLQVAELQSNDAIIKGWLDKNGVFNLQNLFTPSASADKATKQTATSQDTPFIVQLNTLNLNNYQLHIEDRGPKKPVQLAIAPLNLTIKHFSTQQGKAFDVSLKSTLNRSGRLSSKGSVTLAPLNVNLAINSQKIPVNIIQPYVDKFAHLRIRDGDLFVDGNLKLNQQQKLTGDFSGNIAVRNLRTRDTLKGQDFLNWKTLALTGLRYQIDPAALSIKKVLADRLFSKIRVEKDKSTNIGKLFISQPSPQKPATKPEKPMPIHIGQVVIKNSASHFSDFSLILPFTLKMAQLKGKIYPIDSRRHQKANVNLAGKINHISNVSITGSLNPFDIEQFMDIKLKTDSINLSTITPYMAHFAGYEVEKGKISLDLNYRIINKKLQAQNRIIIDQLTLGKEIESPDAVSLPLKLGIALLKDANGVIDLDLPLEGSLDDPQFSITALIGKVLYNLLEKAITSPFSLLGNLIGASGDLSHIEFKPGLALLDESQQQRLNKISEALKTRPALKLEITGLALEKTDRRGLQRQQLLAQIQALYRDDLDDDEQNLATMLSDQVIQRYLPDILEQRFPELDLPDTIETPEGDEILPPDFVQSIWEKLLQSYPVTPQQLKQLADDRANTIAQYLIDHTNLPQQRLFILNARVETEKTPQTEAMVKVPLSLTAQ
jgi:hypothetical protein